MWTRAFCYCSTVQNPTDHCACTHTHIFSVIFKALPLEKSNELIRTSNNAVALLCHNEKMWTANSIDADWKDGHNWQCHSNKAHMSRFPQNRTCLLHEENCIGGIAAWRWIWFEVGISEKFASKWTKMVKMSCQMQSPGSADSKMWQDKRHFTNKCTKRNKCCLELTTMTNWTKETTIRRQLLSQDRMQTLGETKQNWSLNPWNVIA